MILNKRKKQQNYLLGALIGAILAAIYTYFYFSVERTVVNLILLFLVFNAANVLLIVCIAFEYRIKDLKKIEVYVCGVVMWFVSVTLGGGISTLYSTFSKDGILFNISLFDIVLCSAITAALIWFVMWFIKKKENNDCNLYNLLIYYKGEKVEAKGLLDTGNELYEPFSGRPVCIVEEGIAAKWVESCINENKGLYIIPFKSIGKENGILYGVKLDSIIIKKNGKISVSDNVIAAVYYGKLSNDDGYNFILHKEIVSF